jgi:hypothetical protein
MTEMASCNAANAFEIRRHRGDSQGDVCKQVDWVNVHGNSYLSVKARTAMGVHYDFLQAA